MRQAVILAAGEGQRLRPFTANKPKVMLGIAQKPILQYVIEALAKTGIRHIVLIVGYRKEQIFNYFGTGDNLGVDITYVEQEKRLGTAHALYQANAIADPQFLVVSGDNLIEADTISHFVNTTPQAMLVKKVNNPNRYGVVDIVAGQVRSITEKPIRPETNLVSMGIYVFSTEIFKFLEGDLDITESLNRMIEEGNTVKALETADTWLDIVYPWDIIDVNERVLEQIQADTGGTIEQGVILKGLVSVGRNTVIRSNSYIVGPAVIGQGCDIGPNVSILAATSIGNNVIIASFTQIQNSVIGDDIIIGPGCIIQNSVIDNGCVLEANFSACNSQTEISIDREFHLVDIGALLGEGCKIGSNVVAQAGVIVGNGTRIQASKLISGKIPDRSLVS